MLPKNYISTSRKASKSMRLSGGTELFLRHQALGLVEEQHRAGVVTGWDLLLKRVKQLAE